jgi:hypothetical protein
MTEHRDITPEEEALLKQALQNLGAFITEHGQPQYVFFDEDVVESVDITDLKSVGR